MKVRIKLVGYFFLILLISVQIISCKKSGKTESQDKNVSDSFVENDSSTVYAWSEIGCASFKGIYDPRKYTKDQLNSTLELINGFRLQTKTTPGLPEEINKLDVNKLTEEYDQKVTHIKALKIVPEIYFEDLRKLRIREIEEEFELGKIDIEAYSDPKILLNNRFSEHCLKFVTALTSTDSLLVAEWKSHVEELGKENDNLEMYLKEYNRNFNSEDRLEFARIHLQTYGWYNCANELVFHFKNDGTAEKEFEKLFRAVNVDSGGCD